MIWLILVGLASIAARFSVDWTRYLDVLVAIVALLAWGRRGTAL